MQTGVTAGGTHPPCASHRIQATDIQKPIDPVANGAFTVEVNAAGVVDAVRIATRAYWADV